MPKRKEKRVKRALNQASGPEKIWRRFGEDQKRESWPEEWLSYLKSRSLVFASTKNWTKDEGKRLSEPAEACFICVPWKFQLLFAPILPVGECACHHGVRFWLVVFNARIHGSFSDGTCVSRHKEVVRILARLRNLG